MLKMATMKLMNYKYYYKTSKEETDLHVHCFCSQLQIPTAKVD